MKKILVLTMCALLGTSSIFAMKKAPGKTYAARTQQAIADSKRSYCEKYVTLKNTAATLTVAGLAAFTWYLAKANNSSYADMSLFGKAVHCFGYSFGGLC